MLHAGGRTHNDVVMFLTSCFSLGMPITWEWNAVVVRCNSLGKLQRVCACLEIVCNCLLANEREYQMLWFMDCGYLMLYTSRSLLYWYCSC